MGKGLINDYYSRADAPIMSQLYEWTTHYESTKLGYAVRVVARKTLVRAVQMSTSTVYNLFCFTNCLSFYA